MVVDVVPVRRTPTDLRALLDTTLAVVEQQAEATDVSLHVTVADDVAALVSMDSEKMAWVVVALAGNASMRYVRTGSRLRPGGSIRICVSLNRLTFGSAGIARNVIPSSQPRCCTFLTVSESDR